MALLSLPTELVDRIAEHLDINSIRSVRSTCSWLNLQSFYQFRRRFFYSHTLVWDLDGLHNLEKISAHRLGAELQELKIDATPRNAMRVWQLKRDMIRAGIPQHSGVRPSAMSSELYWAAKRAKKTSDYWNETKYDQNVLISVFNTLKCLHSIVFAYRGMDSRYFDRRFCEESQNEMSQPFVSTLAALATSTVTIRSITVHPTQTYGVVSIGRLESISPILAKQKLAFINVETLQLDLRDWRYRSNGFELPSGRVPFVVRFLSKFKNLRKLELSFYSSFEGDILPQMAEHCNFSKLETCKLAVFQIKSVRALLDFLISTNTTLRCLYLSSILLRDGSAQWDDILRRIASDLALEKSDFDRLYTSREAMVDFSHTGPNSDETEWQRLVLEGLDVKRGLVEHANRLSTRGRTSAWDMSVVSYPFVGALN